MYNPYQAASPYGRPPGYGAFPGAPPAGPPGLTGPPGLGAPPGLPPAPGVGIVPALQQAQIPPPGRHGGLPPSFQPPANMPNINFSAPVIRLGTSAPTKPSAQASGGSGSRRDGGGGGDGGHSGSGRAGVGSGHGSEQQRQHMRESMMALVPPTKEEIARTIFVGKINSDIIDDDGIEAILRSAGNLRRWNRATDADGKKCSFGFAEYEDALSLATAVETLKDVRIPKKEKDAAETNVDGDGDTEEDRKLLVVVDENSLNYIEQYKSSRGGEDPAATQARLDNARQALSAVLMQLANPPAAAHTAPESAVDRDGDTTMQNGEKHTQHTEVVTIPLTTDDELADIPAEMRETVAQEIAAFRERSNRRDMERLKREEELETLEKARNMGPQRHSRLASPPPSQVPSGPAGGANGIPLGPRDKGVQGAPSGPKGFQGHQIPREYQKGVTFVNGTGLNGMSAGQHGREDEDTDASDEELESRKQQKREAELEKLYLDQERRWLNRERSRTAAVEREKMRDRDDDIHRERERDVMAKRLREWNDDVEAARKMEEYYADRSMWIRKRASFRQREAQLDEQDRMAEERERLREAEKRDQAKGLADRFLERQAEEMENNMMLQAQLAQQPGREPQRFKLSLGAAAQKVQAAAANSRRRTVAEVEGLLEDEEEVSTTTKRTLIPIKYEEAHVLTPEERDEAVRQLAQEIPSDREGLWAWPVQWEYVDDTVVGEKLKPFVEKKIVEYLGVQEQMLVDVVEDHIRKRGSPQALVEQLEGALDEEAEGLVKKLWRMMIFFSESEKKGLSA